MTYPIQMGYNHGGAPPETPRKVTVGVQVFHDQRDEADRYLIGYRQLGPEKRVPYVSSPDNIAAR